MRLYAMRFGAVRRGKPLSAAVLVCMIGILWVMPRPTVPSPTSMPASSSLGNLTALRRIGKWWQPDFDTQKSEFAAARREVQVIKSKLTGTGVGKPAAVLSGLRSKTSWGSPERAAACYVSAWYGVDYSECRSYLLETCFWYSYGHHNVKVKEPFRWGVCFPDRIDELYEHNHDYYLLHGIMTADGRDYDAAPGEAVCSYATDACERDPRGVLHVANLSAKGRERVLGVLRADSAESLTDLFDDPYRRRVARTLYRYFRRVAADKSDPLCTTARKLLQMSASNSRH